MPKRSPKKTPARVNAPAKVYSRLVTAIESANLQMTGRAASLVNQALVIRNWLIGAYIMEYEQCGADRAKYGAKLLERLAEDLTKRSVKGLDVRTLRDCRMLFQIYPQIRGPADPELIARSEASAIRGTLSSEFSPFPIHSTVSDEFVRSAKSKRIGPPLSDQSGAPESIVRIRQSVTAELGRATSKRIRGPVDPELSGDTAVTRICQADRLPTPLAAEVVLQYSWSKLLQFIRIDDPWKRAFYENECLKGKWSKRQLQRQIESLLYERTGLSKNKKTLVERARTVGVKETVDDMIRDPYVLEFIGLAEREEYSENELESALLDHLQRFLLELGEGFCFEARQFRITVNNKHDRLDLLFYHRRLRCHVLVDLKIRAFRHTDAGQMNFYLNWFKAHMQAEGDNPPVGILLCSNKDGTEVEFATAGMDSQMFCFTLPRRVTQRGVVAEICRSRLGAD